MQLLLKLGPEHVIVGHVLGLHGRGDIAVLGPTVEIHFVAAHMHDVAHLRQVEQLPVQALEDLVGVLVDWIQLAAVRFAAVGRPRLLVHAERKLAQAVLYTC